MPSYWECLDDPNLSREWGCDGDSQVMYGQPPKCAWIDGPCISFEWCGTLYKIYRHPELLISAWCYDFTKEITTDGYQTPNDAVLEEAELIYKSALSKFQADASKIRAGRYGK